MKRSNKALYEQIMRNVSREVKQALLNEARKPANPVNPELFNAIENVALEYGMEVSSQEFIDILSTVIKQAKKMAKVSQTTVTKEVIGKIFINWILGNPYNMNYTSRGYIKFILSYHGGKPYTHFYNNQDVIDDIYDTCSNINKELNQAVYDELLKLDKETLINLVQEYPVIQALLYDEIKDKEEEYGVNLKKNHVYFEFGGNYNSLADIIYDILTGKEPAIEDYTSANDYPDYSDTILPEVLEGYIKE